MNDMGFITPRNARSALAASAIVFALTVCPMSVSGQNNGSATGGSGNATVASLFGDFVHYARLGRFTAAEAFAKQLLEHPELQPTEILELAHRDKDSVHTLQILIKNSSIGENATRVMDLILEGEHQKRKSGDRIRANIENLGRGPQQEFFGQRALAESGEYAIPYMVQTLLDTERGDLRPRLATALSRMGRQAVTPMAMALDVADSDVRMHLIQALGDVGYAHAAPYLAKVAGDTGLTEETRAAAGEAIARISARSGRTIAGSADDLFVELAEGYYRDDDAVRADPTLDTANVWYWDQADGGLRAVVVPQRIFSAVMAMRCADEALQLSPDRADAISLWLSANTRRESLLGMNVESDDPNETGDPDATRPSVFPRALYFAQAAGPRYAHLMLARAVGDRDTAVALGAIEALRVTAGETSLIGTEDYKQPLVQALQFPDQVVRIRAALALGAALPRSPFAGDQYVVPQLAVAVTLTGEDLAVVVDPDQANLNRVMEILRSIGFTVVGDTNFYQALDRARGDVQSLRGMFISSALTDPSLDAALHQMRGEFLFSKTPVVVLTHPDHQLTVDDLVARDAYVERVDAAADDSALVGAFTRVRERTGQSEPSRDASLSLAMEAVSTLHRMATDGRTTFRVGDAESALVSALHSSDEALQTASAGVLAILQTPSAQQAVAELAVDDVNDTSLRIAAFHSLADSAKRNGNLLSSDEIASIVEIAGGEDDLTLRTAASQALGALNIATNKASEIIRSYHQG